MQIKHIKNLEKSILKISKSYLKFVSYQLHILRYIFLLKKFFTQVYRIFIAAAILF